MSNTNNSESHSPKWTANDPYSEQREQGKDEPERSFTLEGDIGSLATKTKVEKVIKRRNKKKPDYDTAMEKYFQLKQKYDNNYKRTKDKYIRNKKLTPEQKKNKIKAIKRKCVICKNVGGMEFTNTGGHLRAICKAATPCNLNINLKRGHYMLIPNILEELYEQKNIKMGDIIKLKLSLLFGLKDKDIVSKEFESQKVEYKQEIDSFNALEEMLKQLNETPIEEGGKEIRISTDIYISRLKQRLSEALTEFQAIIYEYNNPLQALELPGKETSDTPIVEKSIIVLQRAMELYLETIVPLQDKIRRASYAYNAVEDNRKQPTIYSLIQEKHTLTQLEINIPEHEPEVFNMKLR